MKLRILNNSIRLRLSQTEVNEIATGNEVRSETQFGTNGSTLIYIFKKSSSDKFQAELSGQEIIISAPGPIVDTWVKTDQVSMEGQQTIDDHSLLRILIEKDFKCLTDRPHEDESDLFPNPEKGNKNC